MLLRANGADPHYTWRFTFIISDRIHAWNKFSLPATDDLKQKIRNFSRDDFSYFNEKKNSRLLSSQNYWEKLENRFLDFETVHENVM